MKNVKNIPIFTFCKICNLKCDGRNYHRVTGSPLNNVPSEAGVKVADATRRLNLIPQIVLPLSWCISRGDSPHLFLSPALSSVCSVRLRPWAVSGDFLYPIGPESVTGILFISLSYFPRVFTFTSTLAFSWARFHEEGKVIWCHFWSVTFISLQNQNQTKVPENLEVTSNL